MAYETASATDPNDLLDKLRIFALANGWTVDYWGGRTNPGGGLQAGSNQALLMHKSGLYVYFSATIAAGDVFNPGSYVNVYTYPGPWVSGNGTDAQAGKVVTQFANNIAGPYTAYHFFASGNYLHVVLEAVPGRFSHFGAGTLDKAGGGTAVAYCYGLAWQYAVSGTNDPSYGQHQTPFESQGQNGGTSIRADSDGVSPRNYVISNTGSSRALAGYYNNAISLAREPLRLGASAITGRAILAPHVVLVERSPGVFSIAGTPPDLRGVRLDLMAPGDVMTIGSDSWKVFPVIRKNGPAGFENSLTYGFAYRVVS